MTALDVLAQVTVITNATGVDVQIGRVQDQESHGGDLVWRLVWPLNLPCARDRASAKLGAGAIVDAGERARSAARRTARAARVGAQAQGRARLGIR